MQIFRGLYTFSLLVGIINSIQSPFHTSIPRFDELFSQVLKILPSQVENVQEMFDELSAMERSRKKSVILNTGQRHQEL